MDTGIHIMHWIRLANRYSLCDQYSVNLSDVFFWNNNIIVRGSKIILRDPFKKDVDDFCQINKIDMSLQMIRANIFAIIVEFGFEKKTDAVSFVLMFKD